MPRATSRFATWFAAASTWAYVSRWSPSTTAARSGYERALSSRNTERLSMASLLRRDRDHPQHASRARSARSSRSRRFPSRKQLGGLPGLRVGAVTSGGGVGDGKVRPEVDLGDVRDAGPAQPVGEERCLEVGAEGRAATGPVHRTGVDDGGLPVAQETGVPVLRVE